MLEKRGGRKSQITLFVILGIILLIVFLIIYFAASKKTAIEKEFKEESIPEEFKPVRDYVEACIHNVGIEAIKKMGTHGGYIEPLDLELTPVLMRYSSAEPTRFELVSIRGDGEGLIPYYLHVPGKSSFRNYALGSYAPTTESMEAQLNKYILRELPGCNGEFEELKSKGYEIKADNNKINVSSFIREDKIEFFVEYPIDVSKEAVNTKITKYQSTVKFPFKKYYDLAINISRSELENQFLESFTTSLIAYYSGVDTNRLPPFNEYSNEVYIVTWSNLKVRNDLNSLLLSYTPALQVNGTKNYEPIELQGKDVESLFFKSLSMDMFNQTFSNIGITFFYIDNTLISKVQPSKGDIIKPNVRVSNVNPQIPQNQFNTYQFFYDVAYPVIVELRGDEPTTEIPEYSFLFALENNLIENQGVLAWNLGMGTVDWHSSYLNVTYAYKGGVISPSTGQPVDINPPRTITKNLFCDESAWLSGNISVTTVDATSGTPLEGVTVSYGCGDYDECWAGQTKLAENSLRAEWTGTLPICTGGYLSLNKDGYGSKNIMLSTSEGESAILSTQKLEKIREVKATVKKMEILKNIYRDDWEWKEDPDTISAAQDLDENSEQVTLSIIQTGFESGTNPLANSIVFGKDGVTEKIIKLVPGDYEITATFLDNNGIIIPGNCSRICKIDVLVCLDYEYYPNADVNMTPAAWGGVEIKEGGTGNFKITAADLDNNAELEFHVIKLPDLNLASPPGGCIHNLNEMNNISDYSTRYKDTILPVFK